jgi:hypothetical protein
LDQKGIKKARDADWAKMADGEAITELGGFPFFVNDEGWRIDDTHLWVLLKALESHR